MPRKIRQIRIEGNIAYVPLTRGYEAVIDLVDIPLVRDFTWHAAPTKHTVYAKSSGPVSGGKRMYLHRLLMGDPEGLEIDHIDGDGLNNRRYGDSGNLRTATRSQNICNQRGVRRSKSGLKGAIPSKHRWQSQITVNGVTHYLGCFDTAEGAHAAYVKAGAELHGEFARAK